MHTAGAGAAGSARVPAESPGSDIPHLSGQGLTNELQAREDQCPRSQDMYIWERDERDGRTEGWKDRGMEGWDPLFL